MPSALPKTVLITGISSLDNRGVEALLASISGRLRARRPDLRLAVLSRPGAGLDHGRVRALGIQPMAVAVPRDGTGHRETNGRPLDEIVGEASAVVCSGGDLFGRHYGAVSRNLRPLRAAQGSAIPFGFLAQSVGPFASISDQEDWVTVARDAALVTLREPDSYAFVTRDLCLPERRVHQTADPAFLLPPADAEALEAVRGELCLTTDEPLVALAPSHSIEDYAGLDPGAHLAAWLDAARTLLRETPARVLLVPHVVRRDAPDDLALCATIAQRLGAGRRVVVAGAQDAATLKGLIAGCELVIAERMHAAIAGLSTGVPALVVGYSRKAEGIMRQVLGDARGRSLTIAAERFLKPGVAAEQACAAWTARSAVREELDAVLPRIRAMAERNFELLDALLPA